MAFQSIPQLFDLTGKAAVVTGGAVGIGQSIALRLAEAGASIMIGDMDLNAATKTVEQIEARGGKARAIRADVSNKNDANNIIRETLQAFGCLDILVNNAGVWNYSPFLQITEEMWDKVHSINLKGVFLCSQAAAREMVALGKGGKIINVASIDSLHPTSDLAHYDASKGGVMMLTKAMALELGPHNILVNTVAPGAIITTPGSKMGRAALLAGGKTEKELKSGIETRKARIPLCRMGEPDDIAKVILFLASTAADYMTGSLVLVDGGYLLS